MLALLGIALLLHGLAHAGAGMWATGSPWLITPLWWAATTGFLAAGLGALGGTPFRHRVDRLTFTAALCSTLLLYFFRHPLVVPGVVINLLLTGAVFTGRVSLKLLGLSVRPVRHRWGSRMGIVFIAYVTVVMLARPWFMRMGTTPADRQAPLFGDALSPDARYVVDNAITIHAPVDSVWPWLAQIGQDRGGFYSYQRLENAFGANIHNADSIVPAWQSRRAGDFVPAVPRDYLGGRFGALGWRVSAVDSGRALVLENWGAFTLRPIDEHTTQLHIRQRNPGRPGALGTLVAPVGLLVFEPAHFIMQRGMLRGIKQRAERRAG